MKKRRWKRSRGRLPDLYPNTCTGAHDTARFCRAQLYLRVVGGVPARLPGRRDMEGRGRIVIESCKASSTSELLLCNRHLGETVMGRP